jgi:uncharacterized protein YecE (DUF72 family)
MDGFHVGCAGFSGPRGRYFRWLDTWELSAREERVTPRTLGKWRATSPEGARFVPRVSGAVADAGFQGPDAEAAWSTTLACCRKLGADVVLLRTDPSFRPSAANRAALREFFGAEGRCADGLRVAWWAEGLWSYDDHLELCAELGMLPAIDPLGLDDGDDPPTGGPIYWRLMGRRGLASGFSDHELEILLDRVQACSGGYLVFTAPQMMKDARRFALLVGVDAPGGEHEQARPA